MLIMALIHARASGDNSFLEHYVSGTVCARIVCATHPLMQYPLLGQWAEYLTVNTMPLNPIEYGK